MGMLGAKTHVEACPFSRRPDGIMVDTWCNRFAMGWCPQHVINYPNYVVDISFGRSKSSSYDFAVAIARHISGYEFDGITHRIHFSDTFHLCFYSYTIKRLILEIFRWKSAEVVLNNDNYSVEGLSLICDGLTKVNGCRTIYNDIARTEIMPAIPNGMRKSEGMLYSIVKGLFPDYSVIYHYRARWLRALELDIYIPEINIGFEYQGIQHYMPQSHLGGKVALNHQRDRDAQKASACKSNGTNLVEILYNEIISTSLVCEKLYMIWKSGGSMVISEASNA
ncbi:hypothetical protein FACS1894184_08480 [Clostridia bacterium]|nr:hypothetical protein FACS1894184_08480 [Clostridia bacterium]